ncbi:MAG: hypothetical protein GY713_18565, partial [Actinomycetia bacterium]|nr:hypothetical protein [Actinomycetes bacterium]
MRPDTAPVARLLDQTQAPDRVLIHLNATAYPPPLPQDPRIELHLSP